MSLAERNQKVSKVKLVTTTEDPEIEKARKERVRKSGCVWVEGVWRECGGSVEGVWRECGGSVEGVWWECGGSVA